MDEGGDEQAVRARTNPQPFIGDRRVAGHDGVDRYDLDAAALEAAEPDLYRVGCVILGHAEQQEIAGAPPVRLAELPERPAERIEAGGRHIDRAEAPVGGIVRGSELGCPPSGQRLALVASGEEGELSRVFIAHLGEPRGGGSQRFFPTDLAELARSARTDPKQGRLQPGRRIVLHDPGRTLAAQDTPVHRMAAIALDVGYGSILQVHLDAAPAGAHEAGGRLDLVPRLEIEIELRLTHALTTCRGGCKPSPRCGYGVHGSDSQG